MKVPLKWLQEYVDLPASVKELTDRLTAIGHMQDHPPVQVAGDTVLDLEVRQNRSDCLSLVGLAREVAASLPSTLKLPADLNQTILTTEQTVPVEISNPEAAYRFHAVKIEGLKVAPSPEWLKQRVEAYGMKSINNVVDITNYVMVEVGEPLHAFNSQDVEGGIVVRLATEGETIEVLGGRQLKLAAQDIVIADQTGKPLALGGMIGGAGTGVTDATTSIILEAATYNQAYIRRSSLRHSLRTEASLRHEKFLHPDLTEVALNRAMALLTDICGGQVVAQGDAYPHPVAATTITVSVPFMHQLTGVNISQRESLDILQHLGIEAKAQGDETIVTQIPYFRTDLVQEEDVIEEVLRIHGYDKIPDTLPMSPPPEEITSKSYQLEEQIRDILVDLGFDEVITEPLTKETTSVLKPVVLQNSLNADKTMLRTSLRFQLQAALEYQRKARKTEVLLFEIGQVYFKTNDHYNEKKVLAGVVADKTASLLTTKGVLEALCKRLGFSYQTNYVTLLQLEDQAWFFEVDIVGMFSQPDPHAYNIRTGLAQVVYQDLSLAVPVDVKVGELIDTVRRVSPLLYKVTLGELPHRLKSGEKSVFLKLQFAQPEGQMTKDIAEEIQHQIVSAVTTRYSAKLR